MPEEPPDISALLAKANELLANQPATPAHIATAQRYNYYREHFAEEVLETVNHVISTRAPVIWSLSRGTLHTSYQKWNQACRFINDHPHKFPEDSAKKLEYIRISKLPGIGLKFSPSRELFHLSTDTDWKGAFQAFINDSTPGEGFERVGLKLTRADQAWCYNLIKPVIELFAMSIGTDSIKLTRLQ